MAGCIFGHSAPTIVVVVVAGSVMLFHFRRPLAAVADAAAGVGAS